MGSEVRNARIFLFIFTKIVFQYPTIPVETPSKLALRRGGRDNCRGEPVMSTSDPT
jgi:hypothetical protein